MLNQYACERRHPLTPAAAGDCGRSLSQFEAAAGPARPLFRRLAPTLLCFVLSFLVNRVDFVEASEVPHSDADGEPAMTSDRRRARARGRRRGRAFRAQPSCGKRSKPPLAAPRLTTSPALCLRTKPPPRSPPPSQPPPAPLYIPRFQLVYFLVAAIAAYQLASALLISHYGLSPRGRAILAAGCLALLSLVCVVPANTGGWNAVFARDNAAPLQAGADAAAGDEEGRRPSSPGRGAAG